MKTTTQAFAIHIPDANGDSTERIVSIDVPVRWDEIIDEWVLTEEAHEMIDKRKAQELGLLSPVQLQELRERHRQNQKQMGALFQVGEKSWSRWESGKHRPTRSINLLIRALYDDEISINYLREKAGMKGDPLPTNAEVLRTMVRSYTEERSTTQTASIAKTCQVARQFKKGRRGVFLRRSVGRSACLIAVTEAELLLT
jgi:DNA-binding transcriptional regulator YiaG